MKIQFDGLKHALGYAASFGAPFAAGIVLKLDHGPSALYVAAASVTACALTAFVCGAQSRAVFVRTAITEGAIVAKALGVDDASIEVATKIATQITTTETTTTITPAAPSSGEVEDTKP